MAHRWSLFHRGAHLVRRIGGFRSNERATLGPIFSLDSGFSSVSNTNVSDLPSPRPSGISPQVQLKAQRLIHTRGSHCGISSTQNPNCVLITISQPATMTLQNSKDVATFRSTDQMSHRLSLFHQGAHLVRRIGGFQSNEQGRLGPIFSLRSSFSSLSNTNTPKLPPPPPLRYFTPSSTEGAEVVDPQKWVTLQELFDTKPELCFDNSYSIRDHDFSKFSKNIFVKLLTIAYQQGNQKSKYFQFDPNNILVKYLGRVVLDVAVPVSQLQDSDPEVKSIFKDQIVGPFAGMVLLFCLEQAELDPKTGSRRQEHCYKEVYDLLLQAQQGRWWSSLDELLSHPLFWFIEQKMSFLNCMHTWMDTPKPGIPHGISGIKARVRPQRFDYSSFRKAFAKKVFFNLDYTFKIVGDHEEVHVSEFSNKDSWKAVFINNGCFSKSYKFGVGTGEHEFYDMVKFCRHIIVHFEDDNFTAYVVTLDSRTTEVAVINLDRRFSLSLGIFYALKELSIDAQCILAFSPSK